VTTDAVGGGAAGLLGGLEAGALAQVLDGDVDVTVGLGERLLALQHAEPGTLAQFLDQALLQTWGSPLSLGIRTLAGKSGEPHDGGGEASLRSGLAGVSSRDHSAALRLRRTHR
jgi:hypothetical protein